MDGKYAGTNLPDPQGALSNYSTLVFAASADGKAVRETYLQISADLEVRRSVNLNNFKHRKMNPIIIQLKQLVKINSSSR